MKRFVTLCALVIGLAGFAVTPAMARGPYGHGGGHYGGHSHLSIGIGFGAPFYGGYYGSGWGGPGYWGGYYGPGYAGYYYPPAPYYAPAPVYTPYVEAPVTSGAYVEREISPPTSQQAQADDATTDSEGDGSWYYCEAQHKYYPYTKSCSTGWTRVAPQPGDSAPR